MHYRSCSKTDISFPFCWKCCKGIFLLRKMKTASSREICPFHPLNSLYAGRKTHEVFSYYCKKSPSVKLDRSLHFHFNISLLSQQNGPGTTLHNASDGFLFYLAKNFQVMVWACCSKSVFSLPDWSKKILERSRESSSTL